MPRSRSAASTSTSANQHRNLRRPHVLAQGGRFVPGQLGPGREAEPRHHRVDFLLLATHRRHVVDQLPQHTGVLRTLAGEQERDSRIGLGLAIEDALLFEHGLRGGFVHLLQRHAQPRRQRARHFGHDGEAKLILRRELPGTRSGERAGVLLRGFDGTSQTSRVGGTESTNLPLGACRDHRCHGRRGRGSNGRSAGAGTVATGAGAAAGGEAGCAAGAGAGAAATAGGVAAAVPFCGALARKLTM